MNRYALAAAALALALGGCGPVWDTVLSYGDGAVAVPTGAVFIPAGGVNPQPSDGDRSEGPYVDGKKHSYWVTRRPDGTFLALPYVEGKKHGSWVARQPDGTVSETLYVEGKKHHEVFRFEHGGVMEGPYVEGKKHGRWVARYPDGTCISFEMTNGERTGPITPGC